MKRVLIVDDHQPVRRSVRAVLERALGDGVFGEAGGGAETLALVQQQEWDLVLLDLSLPDGSGLEILRQLRRLSPATPVLVMSMHDEAQYGAAARAAGAAGYLAKGGDPAALAAAVRRVLAAEPAPAPPIPIEERKRLAHVLHDELAQALAAVKINLQLARTAREPVELERRLSDSLPLVDQAIESVRQLAARLRVDDLDEEGR
jgi:DNA-binding NarL/FixJ family response regulator